MDGGFAGKSHSSIRFGGLRMMIVKGLEMLLKLKGRVKLIIVSKKLRKILPETVELTSARGIKGGPVAIVAAFVPGRTLLEAASSTFAASASSGGEHADGGRPGEVEFWDSLRVGDLKPICTSGNGGGLGNLGDVEGDKVVMAVVMAVPGYLEGIGSLRHDFYTDRRRRRLRLSRALRLQRLRTVILQHS